MFSSVLVAIDRWEHATSLLDLTRRVCVDNAKIEVIYINRALSAKTKPIKYISNNTELSDDSAGEQIVRDALCYLSSGATFNIKGCIAGGDAAKAIVKHAKLIHCDVIILGHRTLSRINRFLDPSVVAKVIDKAHCPVLVDNSFNLIEG